MSEVKCQIFACFFHDSFFSNPNYTQMPASQQKSHKSNLEVDFPKFLKLPRANFLVDPSRFRDQDLKTLRPEEVNQFTSICIVSLQIILCQEVKESCQESIHNLQRDNTYTSDLVSYTSILMYLLPKSFVLLQYFIGGLLAGR